MNVPKRGIGPATEAALQSFADANGLTLREALSSAGELGLGPKVTGAILELAGILDEVGATASLDQARPAGPADVLISLLQRTRFIEALRNTGDPQDEARAENVEELISVTKEFQKNNPDGTLLDFLTEVSLVAAADELDDSSGTVSLMTLHTAKGLEYEAVFLTGVEEGLLPHQMSAGEVGGPAEERRLFYVGITRARRRLYLSLAMTRAQFGEVAVAMPSRYLQEIPAELIEWKQSPGRCHQPRRHPAARAQREARGRIQLPRVGRSATAGAATEDRVDERGHRQGARQRRPRRWRPGDRIRHADFGDGRVTAVTGVAPKAVAEVQFDVAGRKRLLIKIAPIEKL